MLTQDMRGKLKIPYISSSSALLGYLWKYLGGPSILEVKTGIPRQNFVNWRARGHVPISKVVKIATALNIPPIGLNYDQLRDLYGSHLTWPEVVDLYDIPKSVKKEILSYEYKRNGHDKRRKTRLKVRRTFRGTQSDVSKS